jgi:hypothetical protein
MTIKTPIVCALLCATMINFVPAPAMAVTPAASMSAVLATDVASSVVEQARYRHNRGYRNYGRHRGHGGNIGVGIGAAIIGGIILSEAARADHRNAHGGDWDRCAKTYRSFEPDTGLYTGYDGVRRTCPYLQ